MRSRRRVRPGDGQAAGRRAEAQARLGASRRPGKRKQQQAQANAQPPTCQARRWASRRAAGRGAGQAANRRPGERKQQQVRRSGCSPPAASACVTLGDERPDGGRAKADTFHVVGYARLDLAVSSMGSRRASTGSDVQVATPAEAECRGLGCCHCCADTCPQPLGQASSARESSATPLQRRLQRRRRRRRRRWRRGRSSSRCMSSDSCFIKIHAALVRRLSATRQLGPRAVCC